MLRGRWLLRYRVLVKGWLGGVQLLWSRSRWMGILRLPWLLCQEGKELDDERSSVSGGGELIAELEVCTCGVRW